LKGSRVASEARDTGPYVQKLVKGEEKTV